MFEDSMTLVYSEIFGLNRFFTKILQEYLDGYSGYNIVVKISFISDFSILLLDGK